MALDSFNAWADALKANEMIDGFIDRDLANVTNYLYALLTSGEAELFNADIVDNYMKTISKFETDIMQQKMISDIEQKVIEYLIARIDNNEC